jgi:predicted membrane-bound spermidine synthase
MGFVARSMPNLVVFTCGLAIMLLELVASRLVAKHLGSSLETWTTVIGVILAGMSLGSFWGGRLSDEREPLRTLPLLVGGAALLCASVLVTNDLIGGWTLLAGLPRLVRIVLTIGIVFFPPACLLGTIQPTVARWAVQQTARTGSAIGNLGFWSTAGNILGTFLTGFTLLLAFGTRNIVLASVALLAATAVGVFLLSGAAASGDPVGPTHAKPKSAPTAPTGATETWFTAVTPNALVFISGMSIMVVELVGGRLLARAAGSSIYTWTSLIGVVLAGVSLGNYLGGWLADRFSPARLLPHLFLASSVLVTVVLKSAGLLDPEKGTWLASLAMPERIFTCVFAVFFTPSCALGTISPVVAKLAIERAAKAGAAIGNIYAWGAVGSICGTFLTGFVLVSWLGTKAVLCGVAGVLAVVSVLMVTSGLAHSIWAGVLLAVVVSVTAPDSWHWAVNIGKMLKVREEVDSGEYLRESNYYSIKVYPPDSDGSRTLVLDNLIHGYVVKDQPDVLEYDYELIYASIMERAGAIPTTPGAAPETADASKGRPLRTLFIGGGSYTYPRYIEACYPGSSMLVAEIDPAVTRAAHEALYLSDDTPIVTRWGDARNTFDQLIAENARGAKHQFDFIFGDAFNDFSVPWHLTTHEFNEKVKKLLAPGGVYMINIIDNYEYSLFLGAYVQTARKTFPGVAVFCTQEGGEPSTSRDTFVIAMSNQSIDYTDLGSRPGESRLEKGSLFTDEHVRTAIERSGSTILTDDYAPVENLLKMVARDRD